jgi:triphosphoribosyl-dephospho-CoA synthase
MLPIGLCAQLACIWEATARKPGNVHRYRDFEDCTYVDFLMSAAAIAPVMEKAREQRVGQTVLDAIRATRSVVHCNTNLGIVLLLAPLATVPSGENLACAVDELLSHLDVEDTRLVYEAIRLAAPAGLGQVPEQDVASEPTVPLRDAMALAAGRDLVAQQYVSGFSEVLGHGVPTLLEALRRGRTLEQAIVLCHLSLLAEYPDSLILRKHGLNRALSYSHLARQVLKAGWPDFGEGERKLGELDAWLSSKNDPSNPGTTADMVTACLFVALRENKIPLPLTMLWSGL